MKPIDAIIRLRDQFTPVLKTVSAGIQSHVKDHDRLIDQLRKSSTAQIRFGKDIEKAGNSISGFSKNAAMMAAPLMAAAAAGLKMGSDLTNGMAKVSTLVDTNVVDMGKLRKEIINLSNGTGVAVTDLAEAQYQAISAGVDAANSIEFLGVATKTARAGFTDTTTAIDGLTTVINAYGLANEDAIKISDQMMVAQNFGKTTIDQMSRSLGNVIPIAASLDVQTEELFASIAVLTKNGIGTSEAVTGLKAALSNIVKPTEEATAAAESLNIEFNAAGLQAKGFQGFIEDVKVKLANAAPEYVSMIQKQAEMQQQMQGMKKGTDEYKRLNKESRNLTKSIELMAKASNSPIAGFATMFGSVEALNTMLVLSGKGAADFNKALQLMKDSAGQTAAAYEKMNTPAQQAQDALNELKNSGAEMAQGLAPFIKTTTVLIKGLASWMNSLTEEQRTFLTYAARNIVIFILLTGALGKGISVVGRGIQTFGKFSKAVKDAGSVAAYLKAKFSYAISAFNLMCKGASMAGTGISKLAQLMKTGFSIGLQFGKVLGNGMLAVLKFIGKGFVDLARVIPTIARLLGKNLLTVFRVIGIAARALFMNPIGLAIMGVIAVAVLLYRHWDEIKAALLPTFMQIVNGAKKMFGGLVQFVTGVFSGNWSQAWEGVKDIFSGAFGALAGICKMQLNVVIALVNAAIGEINNVSFTAPDWIPVVGGKTFQPNIPKIPMLYKGTENWGGGVAMIHDRGAEIVDLPRGARVYPHDRSIQMAMQEGVKAGMGMMAIPRSRAAQNAPKVIDLASRRREQAEPSAKKTRESEPKIQVNIEKIAEKVTIRDDRDIEEIAKRSAQYVAAEIRKARDNAV